MYMQYKNSSALNKTSLSQKLSETAVLAIDDQNDDSDDDFVNLDSNSKVDKPTSKTGIKTYFTQLKTEPYTKQDGSTSVRTYFACNLEVDGKPCSRGKGNPISQVGHSKKGGSTGLARQLLPDTVDIERRMYETMPKSDLTAGMVKGEDGRTRYP